MFSSKYKIHLPTMKKTERIKRYVSEEKVWGVFEDGFEKCFIMLCTNAKEKECLERDLFRR
jgi:hypothetical protein